MIYDNKNIKVEDQGPYRTICKVCSWGVHDIVDGELKKGKTHQQIMQVIRVKCPAYHHLAKFKKLDLKKHMAHSELPMDQIRTARKVRRELMRQRKSAMEIQEGMMESLSMILEAAQSITPEDIKEMSVKDKINLIEKFSKIFQSDKKIAIDAAKSKRDEFKFLTEIGNAAMAPMEEAKQITGGEDE